jgi:hypothetical protein
MQLITSLIAVLGLFTTANAYILPRDGSPEAVPGDIKLPPELAKPPPLYHPCVPETDKVCFKHLTDYCKNIQLQLQRPSSPSIC